MRERTRDGRRFARRYSRAGHAQAEVPGKVPGSKAVYEKQVDSSGKTRQYTKTTVDPLGKIVHVKDKINGTVVKP